jgi:hypothetical protein
VAVQLLCPGRVFMKRIPHDGSALLWSALILAASAVSAGCSSSHESSGGDGGGADGTAGAHDGGGPGTGSDGAPSSCPAAYADITWGAPCSDHGLTCDYYGQFSCACAEVTTNPVSWQWLCQEFNCICLPADAGCATFCPNDASPSCINKPCTTDADCPSGQHCGQEIGPGAPSGKVCSFGCEGDAGPGSTASCQFGGTCEPIAP